MLKDTPATEVSLWQVVLVVGLALFCTMATWSIFKINARISEVESYFVEDNFLDEGDNVNVGDLMEEIESSFDEHNECLVLRGKSTMFGESEFSWEPCDEV